MIKFWNWLNPITGTRLVQQTTTTAYGPDIYYLYYRYRFDFPSFYRIFCKESEESSINGHVTVHPVVLSLILGLDYQRQMIEGTLRP